jgi:hypothetical protein
MKLSIEKLRKSGLFCHTPEYCERAKEIWRSSSEERR